MKTTLVAHLTRLGMVGLLVASPFATLSAQSDNGEDRRPRLKLPRARQEAPHPAHAEEDVSWTAAPSSETPRLGVMVDVGGDGIVVAEVNDGSIASAAGLLAGDILLNMNGTRLDEVGDIAKVLKQSRPGQSIEIGVIREGAGLVKLDTTMPSPPKKKAAPKARTPVDGHQGGFLGVQLGEGRDGGVSVEGVVEQSAAWFAGLEKGDVLTSIGDQKVKNGEDVVGAVASKAPGQFVRLGFVRDGENQTARARIGARTPATGNLGNSNMAPAMRFRGNQLAVPHNLQGNNVFFLGDDEDGAHGLHEFKVMDGDGNVFFSDDEHEPHALFLGPDGEHEVKIFDGGDWVHEDGGDFRFDFDMDDLDLDLGELEDFEGSMRIQIEDGVMTIDRNGEVQTIDLGDVDGAHGAAIKVLPKGMIQGLKGLPGQSKSKIQYRVKKSSSNSANTQGGTRVKTLSFATAPEAKAEATDCEIQTECEIEIESSCESSCEDEQDQEVVEDVGVN